MPERIVSLLDPDFTFPEFGSVYAARLLRIRLHDAHVPGDGRIVPAAKHIADLLAFVAEWTRTAPLLIHCRAGIGRSPAVAFITACFCSPHTDEFEIAQALRIASPTARPNEVLVKLADEAMGRGGRMQAAMSQTGRGLPWPAIDEGVPFELPAVYERPRCAVHLSVPTWQKEPNKPDAANPAIASQLQTGHPWRGVADPGRWASMYSSNQSCAF
jgi:predicted protein tyrosine phosphatase